jgi:hypothetical protein
MSNFNKLIFVGLFFVFIIPGCSVKKNIPDTKIKSITEAELKQKLNSLQKNTKQLVIKGTKITIDDNSSLTNLKANFIISKDSAILISVSNQLGIEISRAILLPDSIKVLDRINRIYSEDKFSELEKKFSVALDFYQIQSILTGDYKYSSVSEEVPVIENELISENGNYKLVIPYKNESNDRLENLLFVDQNFYFVNRATMLFEKKKQEFEIVYGDYMQKEEFFFPGFIEVDYKKNRTIIKIAIQNKNISIEPPRKIQIDVPSSYERKR